VPPVSVKLLTQQICSRNMCRQELPGTQVPNNSHTAQLTRNGGVCASNQTVNETVLHLSGISRLVLSHS
jgi:hypothetical protein